MTDWNCPVCGFEAESQEQKDEHMNKMTDSAHQEAAKQKVENAASDVKEKVEDSLEDVEDKAEDVTSDIREKL